jgi:outer membrane lipoprotein
MQRFQFFFLLVGMLVLSACATTPKFNLSGVDKNITPKQVTSAIDEFRSKDVLWGGVIINSNNLKKGTMLEVLAYPLDNNMKPLPDNEPLGRFIAVYGSYLETVDYGPGRLLTIVGKVSSTTTGMVGETEYTYPEIKAEQLHLWSKTDVENTGNTRFHFGIGITLHN